MRSTGPIKWRKYLATSIADSILPASADVSLYPVVIKEIIYAGAPAMVLVGQGAERPGQHVEMMAIIKNRPRWAYWLRPDRWCYLQRSVIAGEVPYEEIIYEPIRESDAPPLTAYDFARLQGLLGS